MIKIRYSRIRKFGKKNWKAAIIIQSVAIWYLLIITTGYLTSDTGAYFNDTSQVTGTIQAGTWEEKWDKSSLAFPNKDQTVTGISNGSNTCQQIEISTDIINNGSNMQGNSTYEVYYIASGNPKSGEKVGDGIINPILSNKSEKLKYLATKPGNYKFRALQRPGHANNYDTRQDLWSETITLTCPTKSSSSELIQQNEQNTQPSSQTNSLNTGTQNSVSDSKVQNNSLNSGTQKSDTDANVQNNSSNGVVSENTNNNITSQSPSDTNNQSGSTNPSESSQTNGNNSTSP